MSVKKSNNPVVASLSGAIAGGLEAVAIWPMEMIKTNLQLGTMNKHYNGMLSGFRYHIKSDGFFSLYRGLTPVLMGSIPKAGVRFGGFDILKKILSDENGKTSPIRNLAAGVGAGAIEATIITTPMETVKTRLIDGNSGLVDGMKRIIAKEGISGMYKGLTATILKQSSNQGLRFMWFSEYKARIPNFLEKNGVIEDYTKLSQGQLALVNLCGGMSAGCFSTLGNNPFDVVKTRMQGLNASKYKNTFDCVGQILKNEGPLAFYSGVIPRLGRVVPGQGVIFMSYESISAYVEKSIEKK